VHNLLIWEFAWLSMEKTGKIASKMILDGRLKVDQLDELFMLMPLTRNGGRVSILWDTWIVDLSSLIGKATHRTTWDIYGKEGWGVNGTSGFMSRNEEAPHATNAHDKLKKYYDKCSEAFVEKHLSR